MVKDTTTVSEPLHNGALKVNDMLSWETLIIVWLALVAFLLLW